MSEYKSAAIEASVKVYAYRQEEPTTENLYGRQASRTVTLEFRESFEDDTELDVALDVFTRAVKEAARR